jgi:hypothetical protein
MEKIRTLNSFVAIKIPYIVRDKIEYGSLKLDLETTSKSGEESLAVTHGVVVALPETMTDVHNHVVTAEMNLEVGDKVYFDKLYSAGHGRITGRSEKATYQTLYETEDGKVLLVPFGAIYMADRNGELISCNDFVIGSIIEKPQHFLQINKEYYRDRILVEADCPKNVTYLSGLPAPWVEKGKIAICAQDTIIPIQDHYESRQLFRIRRRQLVGTA